MAGDDRAGAALASRDRDTEQRLAELEAVYDAAPVGLCVLDTDLRFVRLNQRFAEMNGVSVEEHIGRTPAEVVPDLGDQAEAAMRRVLETGEMVELEVRGTTAARPGIVRHWDERWKPIRDGAGEIIGISISAEEVTERKAAEAALHEAEERYRFALDAARFGTFDFRVDTGEVLWDDRLKTIWGLAADTEIDFAGVVDRVHPHDRERVQQIFAAALAPDCGGTYEADYRIVLPDGSVRWTSARGRVHFQEKEGGRTAVRVVGIEHDITERVEAEAALREANARLEERVRERTAELEDTNARLLAEAAERTQAAAALQESEQRYRELVEGAGSVILRYDPAGRITFINEFAERFFGYSAEELLGQHVVGTIVPETESSGRDLAAMVRDILCFPERYAENENENLRKNGERVWLRWTNKPILNPDGTVREFLGIAMDISERKRAEAALKESEERFRLALRNAPTAVFHQDADLRYTWYSNPHPPFFTTDLLGKTDADVMAPEDAAPITALKLEVLATGESRRGEVSVTIGGATTYYDLAIEPKRDAQGRTVGIMGVSHDITERRRTEAALRESEARFRSVLDQSNDVIYRYNLQTHRIEYISPSCEAVVGFTPVDFETITAEKLLTMLDPEDRPAMQAAYACLERTGDAEVEYRLRTKDGEYRWLSNHMSLIRDADGRPLYRDGIIRDISIRKQADAALKNYTDRLARSNEELQRFAYVASHDLQEPLRSIVSFSQLLERRYRGKLDTDADEYIAFIVEGGNRMQRLIQDLLQVSRVETGAKPLAPTDACEVVAEMLRSMDAALGEAGATVEVGDLPRVMADAAQLQQVFANLVSNAIKYCRDGVPPVIAIGAKRLNGMVEFSVADNGIGIEAEYFDRIFEMFRRLHTHDRYEGTGIGLAVVKRIVERHGGRIRVESMPGEGSTFFFTLPAA